MKIPLFDNDWTLLEGGNKAHINSFGFTIKQVFGIDVSLGEIFVEGKIDSQIILELLDKHEISEENVKPKLEQMFEEMYKYFQKHQHEGIYKPMPGVTETLSTLKAKNIPIGLLTGNIEKIALSKLTKAGIRKFFSFGAFGNLASKRVELIEIAKKRAKEAGVELKNAELILVGDSVLDVKCAKEGQLKIVGVASGKFSAQELQQAGADLVIKSLNERDNFFEFLND